MRMLVSILLFAAATFTLQAQALDFGETIRITEAGQEHREGGHYRPDHDWYRPGDGQITCSAVDAGWEEHWRGHVSCGECLSKHGRCIETCERVTKLKICQFEGRDYLTGRFETFVGRAESRYEAEYAAKNRCYRAGYRDCRYVRCDIETDREVVSRRQCR